ncbi:MAG: PHP domain-containing protein [Clostridiales Family XIII bacterium]|jgi:PHP family Zn ribbon phosphoesterase|nr:PHP domain-containing protein [Clostridiales Family XIII bacterium]
MKEYKYDLHIHSALSPCADEEMTPNNIARMCMLGGIEIAALTDHNTTANCPAFFRACVDTGVLPVAGCEVNTSEEIHVLSLFPRLESAMKFSEFLYPHIPDISNDPDVFGRQVYMDENDAETGTEEKLLIAATDISMDDIYEIVRAHGGVAVPAHIDRPAFSLLYNFGFIPDGYPFRAYEICAPDDKTAAELIDANPLLDGKTLLFDSDAHTLAGLVRDAKGILLSEPTAAALIDALR